MSELGNRDKGVYYNLLANNGATFFRDSQGRIVANIRILGAKAVVTTRHKKLVDADSNRVEVNTLPFEERLKRLKNIGNLSGSFSFCDTHS